MGNEQRTYVNSASETDGSEREFTLRALVWGVAIGLVLLALMLYLMSVVGMDISVSPVASMLGIFLIPLFGGKTTRKEVNIMQTCASAVAFSSGALVMSYVAAMMLGLEFRLLDVFIPLLLANVIGICFISVFRKQYVEDPDLPFPQAVMARVAVDKVGQLGSRDAKILFTSVIIGLAVSLLQNYNKLPNIIDFTSVLPAGMTMGILIMPMMIGMGYILGAKAGIMLAITSLIVNLIFAPIGTRFGWFADPGIDFSGLQNFNLPIVIGISLFASLVPIIRQRKSFVNAFRFDKASIAEDRDAVPMKSMLIVLAVAIIALVAYCHIFYHIGVIQMFLFILMSILFSFVCVRVTAESGLSAALALGICQIIIVNFVTGNIIIAMIICYISSSISMLAQNTMGDLRTGYDFDSSPKKQIWAQFIGVIPGCIFGVLAFYSLIKVYGLDSSFFSYPLGKMYYSLGVGISSTGGDVFNLGRFAIGGGLGAVLSLLGLPAGGIALAAYLAPATIMSIGAGGVIRLIMEKAKTKEIAEKYNNAATGFIIGDALVSISIVFITMMSM